jgi:hypothetical protein
MIIKETPFGTRQRQEYQVALGQDTSKADSVGQGVGLLYTKNLYWDRQLGAAFVRGGSLDIPLTGIAKSTPLSIGEHVSGDPDGQIQVSSTALLHCTGPDFRSIDETSSTAVTENILADAAGNKLNESRPSSMVMSPGTKLFIAAGKVCTWAGPGETVYQHGLNAPTQAASFVLEPITGRGDVGGGSATGGITLVDGAKYIYTYYSSALGMESDWSPDSANTGAFENNYVKVTVFVDGLMDARIDKIRIYRTLDGGTKPYLVGTVDLPPSGTTSVTYQDISIDDILTAYIGKRGDRAQLQDQTFVISVYANHMWAVDSTNPRKLKFSKPYTGSDNDLEYWPTNNFVITSEPITALLKIPGKLLVFHPRSISYVSGTSIDDFQINTFKAGIGTVMPQSVATDGKNILFLSEQGWANLASEGSLVVSREIDEDLRDLIEGSYNVALRTMAVYNYGLRQFICIISAIGVATQPWEDVDTGELVLWENSTTPFAAAVWETTSGYVPTASLRNKVWGYSPDISGVGNRWCEYEFNGIADLTGNYPTCCLYRQPSNATGRVRNNSMLLGWYGTDAYPNLWRIFDDNQAVDDGAQIEVELLTDRMSPGLAGNRKIFTHIQLPTIFSDLTYDISDDVPVYGYLLDFDSPSLRSDWRLSLNSVPITGNENKTLPVGLGKFVHFYLKKKVSTTGELVLQNFYLHFRERRNRGNR